MNYANVDQFSPRDIMRHMPSCGVNA